jgi:hypothetical protein
MALTKVSYSMISSAPVNVADYGAIGDGVTDNASAFNAAFAACPEYGTVVVTQGSGVFVIGSQINLPKNNTIFDGGGCTLKAKDSVSFNFLLSGTSRSNCIIRNVTLDANKAGRTSTQSTRFMGAEFASSEDCSFENVTVKNTRGYLGIPAVGLGISAAIRNTVDSCTFIDCGDASPNASDGVYTAGESTLISNCIAINCTDTAFVLENSNYSGIVGCTSNACAVGIGITAATSSDYRGNFASGVTINNWNSSVTGGIQIGVPTATTGNLYDTALTGITMTASLPTYGSGPAVNIRSVGSGKAIGVSINGLVIQGSGLTRAGATLQGVVVNGDSVRVRNSDINVTQVGVNFLTGTVDGVVSNCTFTSGTFAIATGGTAKCNVQNNICDGQSSWGIYAFDTSEILSTFNIVKNATVGGIGKDAGATINLVGQYINTLSVNNASGSATSGSIVNKFIVTDRNGNALGYVPVYNI